ncbi:hypothetical protein V6N13_001545 [Hibiscus sabdariffa]
MGITVTLRSGKQCETETSAKEPIQCQENEPIEEPSETVEKKESESSNASHQTNANPQDNAVSRSILGSSLMPTRQ